MSRRLLAGMLIFVVFLGAFYARVSPVPPTDCAYYATGDYEAPVEARYEMVKAETSGGGFYYHYFSGRTGPLVVLVAGALDAHYFDAVIALLQEANYRVLVLDLPGKEHTRLSRPPTADAIFEQFQEFWIGSPLGLRNEENFLIVGSSTSGPVTALMAARWADRKPKLALMSVVGMPRDWDLVIRFGRVPVLSDLLAPFAIPWQEERQLKNGELLCPQNFPKLFKRQETELRGVSARVNHLELGKALVLSHQTSVYEQAGRAGIPVMLAYGDPDPYRDQIGQLTGVMSVVKNVTIAGSGHLGFVEQPDATFRALDEFFKTRVYVR